jgi:phage terminase large subunit
MEKNYKEYLEKKYRFILNQGGTGSSKSFSLAQLFVLFLLSEKNSRITICRKSFPSLRATAMHDFFAILKEMKAYKEDWHNKTENIYIYKPTGTQVDFLSIDEPMKVRSRRRDYIWVNEANELKKEDFEQLNMRTNKQMFMDYNPSDMFHWIYDDVEPRKDTKIIVSTYLDNPFLSKEIVKEIENYKNKDLNYWRVYGLGLKGMAETIIYKQWNFGDRFVSPENVFYGLDFGFNNPTALVRVEKKDQDYYCEEVLYERYLTNQDLLNKLLKLKEDGKIPENTTIYADSAEPARIEELSRALNVQPCFKGKIKDGIDTIKSHKLFISRNSVNLQKEIRSYSWKVVNGKPTEEAVKENDHLLDAMRYAIMTESAIQVPLIEWV